MGRLNGLCVSIARAPPADVCLQPRCCLRMTVGVSDRQLEGAEIEEVKVSLGSEVLLGCGRNPSFTVRLHSPAAGHSHFLRGECAASEQHGRP